MYLDHFGLTQAPFSVTSDPAFLYFSQKHQGAFDALLYGIQMRSGFIEITGDIGSGKTTICRALLNRLAQEQVKTAYIFNTSLSEIQLLQTLLTDLGLSPVDKTRHGLFNQLNHFLIEQLSKNHNVALIIDESQNLSVKLLEQIRMLSNLETDKEKLLQIVLVGQPELKDKLNLPELKQLRQRIAVRYHLTPLTCDDLRGYIYHRLHIAGATTQTRPTFLDNTFAKIYEYSGGVPRMINLVCDKALLAAYVQDTRHISAEIIQHCIDELEGVYA